MENKKDLRKWMFLIIFAILSYWIINNFSVIIAILKKIIKVLFPFILDNYI